MLGVEMTETPHEHGNGVQRLYTFLNDTKLSAIKTDFSYGGAQGLWEIAVVGPEGGFITREVWYDLDDDVLGHVTDTQLESYISDVQMHDLEAA